MKVSEVIKDLQDFMEEYGDCECWHMVGDDARDYKLDYDRVDGYTGALYFTCEGLFLPEEYINYRGYKDDEYELVCIMNA